MPAPLIIAARGDTESAPENTLAAFAAAIENGADTIEFDVHPTRDGELIVHHDYYLERTTDGSGPLAKFTLDQLQRLDAGSWFGREFRNERIPTLTQVLELGRHRVQFEVDLWGTTLPFLRAVLTEIARFELYDRVELTSPHIPLLCRIPAENSSTATCRPIGPPQSCPITIASCRSSFRTSSPTTTA
jgi:glycerophosphoryl diester phosphodiesterase